jgi:hypothetical protein
MPPRRSEAVQQQKVNRRTAPIIMIYLPFLPVFQKLANFSIYLFPAEFLEGDGGKIGENELPTLTKSGAIILEPIFAINFLVSYC